MSLRTRIAVVIFLLVAVMMSCILIVTVNKSQKIYAQQIAANEDIILKLLSGLSRIAMFSNEYQDLNLYIDNISKDPHVRKIIFQNYNNMILSSSEIADVGRTQKILPDIKGAYWRTHKVENDSGLLGKVSVNFSNAEIHAAKKAVLITGFKIALIGMSILAFAAFISGRLLTRRLAYLLTAAREIKVGNLDVRFNLSGRDELAVLGQTFDEVTKSFKTTVNKLTNHESELESIKNDLENRVNERTEELSIANEELEHLATHDPLTNLPNRSLLLVRLQQSVTHCDKFHTSFALLMLDLDRFKEVNDTLGHDIGDELLVIVSQKIRAVLRKSDTIARLGGDEFCIILLNITQEEAIKISNSICAKINENVVIKFHHIGIGASIGITFYPEHSKEIQYLMKNADIAMYRAKRNKLNYVIYDASSNEPGIGKESFDLLLTHAIANDELVLHYQPKVEFHSGKLVGVEALLRWQTSDRLIYPDEFIPFAEKTGQIKLLTRWVINAALQQLSLWNKQGIELKMSINISMRDLDDPIFSSDVAKQLKTWQVNPNHLTLEITETGVMSDPNKALSILHEIDDLGVEISIDDFGTGYSSLIYLKKLPVDELKIDQSFVNDILSDSDSMVIVKSIIDLAHNLGITVTAEGVENEQVWNILSKMGCNIAQGHYTGKPMPETDIEKLNVFGKKIVNL